MSKVIEFNESARQSLKEGVDALANAAREAGATLIAGDGPNELQSRPDGGWIIVLDSETVPVPIPPSGRAML